MMGVLRWLAAFSLSVCLLGWPAPLQGQQPPAAIEVLRAAVDPTLAPVSGFSMDVFEVVAAQAGFSVQWVAVPFLRGQRLLQEGSVDVLLAVPYSSRRAERMEFTDPYLSSSVSLVVRRDDTGVNTVDHLSSRVVAIQRDSGELDFLQNVWRINFNITESLPDALALLLQGRASVVSGDRLVLRSLLEEQGAESDYRFATTYVMPLEYAIAVRQENFALLNRLNPALQRVMGTGAFQEIQERWFGREEEPERLLRLLRTLGMLLSAVLVVFFLSLWWNRMLKMEVSRKTHETRTMSGLMEQIMSNSPRGLITVDRDGTISAINPRGQKLLGEVQSLKGVDWRESEILREIMEPRVEAVLQDGRQYVGGEVQHRRSGTPLDIRYTLYPARVDGGGITGMIVTLEDITEERRVREEDFEREKSRALHQVVAGIAHEIRNPLTSIKTFVELLPAKMHNPQFRENIVRYVPREIDRVSQLIESLINYARPNPPQRERFQMDELLRSCVVLFGPVFSARGFSLKEELQQGCLVDADRNQIKQVMVNFLLNGLGAMEEQLRPLPAEETLVMTVRCRCDGAQVVVELEDQGVGMDRQEMAIMLDPFYTTKEEGAGLGLTLSKRFLEENRATMTFASEKGRGTTVTVRFTRETPTRETPTREEKHGTNTDR